MKRLEGLIPTVDVVALSDYGKGFLSNRIIQKNMQLAKLSGRSTIVDPKGTDFSKYRGASLIKPNLSEAYAAAKCSGHVPLDEVAKILQPFTETLLITRSEAGISVFHEDQRSDFPVRSKEVKDVTDAGDTVLAMLCFGFANQLGIDETDYPCQHRGRPFD